jgi:hypothetical protein
MFRNSVSKLSAIILLSMVAFILHSCDGDEDEKIDLKDRYHNDLESYDGWLNISGYYNLKSGEGRSGNHCIVADPSSYTMSFIKPLNGVGDKTVKKVTVSVWVKCLAAPANGSYVVSVEKGNETLKYFSFNLSQDEAVVNEWREVKGVAHLSGNLPEDALLKIYFWNKSKAAKILVDDFDFVMGY